jgi:hypothetical protein
MLLADRGDRATATIGDRARRTKDPSRSSPGPFLKPPVAHDRIGEAAFGFRLEGVNLEAWLGQL